MTTVSRTIDQGSILNKSISDMNGRSKVTTALMVAGCIAVPLAIGGLSAALTGNAMSRFGSFNQPPLSPPAILFPIAWTGLYILMGLSSYFILRLDDKIVTKNTMLALYVMQLAINFVWSPIFFLAGAYWLALIFLVLMLGIVLTLTVMVRRHSMAAFLCLVPYAAWCAFATYLNLGVAIMN